MKNSLTEQDQKFASEISNEFKIPLQDLANIISDLRKWKQFVEQKKDGLSTNSRDLLKVLNSPDFLICKIRLETANEDIITIKDHEPEFYLFKNSIDHFRDNLRKEAIQFYKEFPKRMNNHSERQLFSYFISYFKRHEATLTYQCAVIGKFLIHFDINKRLPIMTYEQWLNNPGSSDNYPDYLYGIVKNRYKKYLKNFIFRKP